MVDTLRATEEKSLFQQILIPLDGSQLAEQAIPAAARIARATGGSILLLRVMDELREFGTYTTRSFPSMQDILEEERRQATAYLTQIASSKALDGITTHIVVLPGSIAAQILDVARDEQINLIIMCSHGRTGFKRWALGSVAQKVVRRSSIPVLLLRKDGQKLSRLSHIVPHPVRALVALDGSPFAETMLQPTVELVAALSAPAQGEVHLTHLVKLPTVEEEMAYERLPLDTDIRRADLYQAGEYLQEVRHRLSSTAEGSSVNISWSVEEASDIAETLVKLAERGEGIAPHLVCDLVALTTHGRGGIQHWHLGSVTERVLEHSLLPAFVVHAAKQVAEEPAHLDEEALQVVVTD